MTRRRLTAHFSAGAAVTLLCALAPASAAAASASGSVWGTAHPSNGSGQPLAGARVYADTNRNGQRDPGEPSTLSGADGGYQLNELPAGRYALRLEPGARQGCITFVPGACASPSRDWSNATVATDDFYGAALSGTVRGRVFDDQDGDGVQDPGEGPLAGVWVFQEFSSGSLARLPGSSQTQTAADGSFQLEVAPGNGPVRLSGAATATMRGVPARIEGLSGVGALQTTDANSCALLTDGGVRCWGSNRSGQLGNGQTSDSALPVPVSGLSDATALAVAADFACALRADTTVRCWGSNDWGKLGDDSRENRATPVAVVGLSDVDQLAVGPGQACARQGDGTVVCWGSLAYRGANQVPVELPEWQGARQLAGGSYGLCALLADASVSCLQNGNLEPVAGVADAVQLSVGFDHACALLASGTISCWGSDYYGQLGDGTRSTNENNGPQPPGTVVGISDAQQVIAGAGGSCAVLGDRNVRCWGDSSFSRFGTETGLWDASGEASYLSTPVAVPAAAGADALQLGNSRLCALRDGQVACWGDGFTGLQAPLFVGDVAAGATRDIGAVGVVERAPTPALSGPDRFTSSAAAQFNFQPPDGMSWNFCQLDGRDDLAGDCSQLDFSDLEEGPHTLIALSVRTQTPVLISDPAVYQWTVDRTPPEAPQLTGTPAAASSVGEAAFAWAGESGASFQCALDGAEPSSCATTLSLQGLADGSHTLQVWQQDQAGNLSAPASFSWTVSLPPTLAAPAPTLTATPPLRTNSQSAQLGWSGEPGASFQCSLDGAVWSACTSPTTSSGLTDGPHSYRVRQKTARTLWSDPALALWTVDRTPPAAPQLTARPATMVNSTAASFSFNGEDGASFSCRLDNGAWSACTSPRTFSGLSAGTHILQVRQSDLAGNTGVWVQASWTIDLTPPVAPSWTSRPAALSASANAQLGWSGESGASFQCSLDGAGWSACSSPLALLGLDEGAHTLQVRQTDLAGNQGPAASASWTVDTRAPEPPAIVSQPASQLEGTAAQVVFSAEPGSTAWCRLDNGPWTACTSPRTLSGLSYSAHTLRLKASDPAGNFSTEVVATWTNLEPPPPSVTSFVLDDNQPSGTPLVRVGGAAYLRQAAPVRYRLQFDRAVSGLTSRAFAVSGTAGGWAVTSLAGADSGPYTVVLSPVTARGGQLQFGLRARSAVDGNGLFGPREVQLAGPAVALDLVAPLAPALGSNRSGRTSERSAQISITAEAGATLSCQLDGAPLEPCSSPLQLQDLADGLHTVQVRQSDLAGNQSPPATVSWTVKNTPPDAPQITGRPPSTVTTGAAALQFSGERQASFSCRLDEGEWRNCATIDVLLELSAGAHTWQVRQTDELGKTSPAASAAFTAVDPQLAAATPVSVGRRTDAVNCDTRVSLSGAQATWVWFADGTPAGRERALRMSDPLWAVPLRCVMVLNRSGTASAWASAPLSTPRPLPRATAAPFIRREGATLSCNIGSWKYGPLTYALAWLRNGQQLERTDATYPLEAGDTGASFSCRVTASNTTGASTLASSVFRVR